VKDRRDLDYIRVFASRPTVVGRPLSDLDLPGKEGTVVLHVRRGDADRHLSVDGPAGGAVQQRAEIAAVDDAAAVEVLGAGIGLDDRPVLVGPDDPEAEVLGERPGADARVV
jgi:uncharacterized transporter YbjL